MTSKTGDYNRTAPPSFQVRTFCRGQLFTTDFLTSVLVITVALGLFVHSMEFSVRSFPDSSSLAPALSSALLGQRHLLTLDPARMSQSATECRGKADALAWCYPLLASDGSIASRYYDSDATPSGSLSMVFENGVPLGPAHASAAAVQTLGNGSFSDFFDSASGQHYLLFSSGNGTAPNVEWQSYVLEYRTVPIGLDRASGAFCVSESISGAPARTIQDNCASLQTCPVRSSSDRLVACGTARCTFSVRVCGGVGS